jgi:hypothetical protein
MRIVNLVGKIPLPALARVIAIAVTGAVLVGAQSPSTADVPSDLRPFLVPRQSEMRLVVRRYTLDRQTLSGNYAGSPSRIGTGGAFAGTANYTLATPGPGAAPETVVAISTARHARLKRFDLSWQAALKALDATRLPPAAARDRATLLDTIWSNIVSVEADAAWLADVTGTLPFLPAIVDLVEARVRIRDVDAQQAARLLTALPAQLKAARDRVESDQVRPESVVRAAAAAPALQLDLAEWFHFYNGYDPAFTWWVARPYAAASSALDGFVAFLRGRADPRAAVLLAPMPIEPASPSKFADVPNLGDLIALPQDELIEIVRRFRAMHEGPADARRVDAYRRWLDALKTLDFASLSRNAQIDYLFIKRTSQLQIERAATPLPANPPRKTDNSGITGDARGREGLLRDLADEIIPYTPEELIALADRELAWVEAEMKKASRELGFGDDWKRAVEHVKDMHPPPGGQPAAVRDLMFEAVDYLRQHDLLTVPTVAAESLQMVMLTPEQQLINPFFRGGPRISVSYPTDTMTYDQRVQSMRGNNTPFSHATAHHEMIPGHNLDDFYRARYEGYRAELVPRTPFFREGWALYWELLLWDRGFNDTPAERIGALFWRMHRSARITFSLKFHMGQWSPQEAVDFLVDRVGHERENATAEVRRSFRGDYGPLYQAAYLLGGIQIRSLYRDLVESKRMTAKAFHDAMLRQNAMPIALLRLAVGSQPLTLATQLEWKFYGELR